jgi:SAM-dependent methyltransferase
VISADLIPFLTSPAGEALLADLHADSVTEQNHLAQIMRLRREIGPERARAALETVLLRQRAAAKFSRAATMLFDRAGLEMASAEIVSAWRARRYAPFGRVADLGCGLGGDALALAAHSDVIGIDRDATRLALAAHNVAVYDRGDRFTPLHADLLTHPPVPADALFFDPARRDANGRRLKLFRDYQPAPLELLARWQAITPHQGVKVSPAVAYADLPAGCEVTFLSVAGEVREGVLWFGDLRRGVARQAVLLPQEAVLAVQPAVSLPPVTPPGRWLFEPDGAVIRAHLVAELAAQEGLAQIDPTIAYLTGDRPIVTPFARAFEVVDWFPFQLKRLRSWLRERKIGRLTIKKRGSPLDPDVLRQQLRPQGEGSATLFLTRVQGVPAVIVTRDGVAP